MKTVVYLDLLLILNFMIACILLESAGFLCGAAGRPFRLCGGAAAAALSSLILLAPELPFVLQLLYQAGSAALIVRLAFPWKGSRCFFRAAFWYLLLNLLLAGLVSAASLRGSRFLHTNNLAVYFAVSPILIFCCAAGIDLSIRALLWLCGRPAAQCVWMLRPEVPGWRKELPAFYDTGFLVQDPFSDRAPLLLFYPSVRSELPAPWRDYLDAAFSARTEMPAPPPTLHVHFVECSTAAGRALLPGFPVGEVSVRQTAGRAVKKDCLLLFAAGPPSDARYPVLFGPAFYEDLNTKESCLCK